MMQSKRLVSLARGAVSSGTSSVVRAAGSRVTGAGRKSIVAGKSLNTTLNASKIQSTSTTFRSYGMSPFASHLDLSPLSLFIVNLEYRAHPIACI